MFTKNVNFFVKFRVVKLKRKDTGEWVEATIEPASPEYLVSPLLKGRFTFDWMKEKGTAVFWIRLKNEEIPLGIISIEDIPRELRIFIRLLEVSRENTGRNKMYEGIAGCLIAFACTIAFQKDYDGFVSLIPKSELINHYKNKYGFREFGTHLFLEGERSDFLIKQYLENG